MLDHPFRLASWWLITIIDPIQYCVLLAKLPEQYVVDSPKLLMSNHPTTNPRLIGDDHTRIPSLTKPLQCIDRAWEKSDQVRIREVINILNQSPIAIEKDGSSAAPLPLSVLGIP
jgi:hypothetical protein